MSVSGAGKTTLLDILANHVTMSVVTEEITVHEFLIFSTLLHQPFTTSHAEKIAYVEEVIKILGMQEYTDAVVGVLEEGLNIEQ
ncbi:hypothetical protein GX51_07873 [Blastomyces parvus]|uniref:ABC transporter domain-containing protein n=1 Tax=Blastomyces parvus TaxID=2060905 RepID=A0A2B7W9W5_9EURO|nr:hypothetical protein GX51_07873 [Blastomyces parvus]